MRKTPLALAVGLAAALAVPTAAADPPVHEPLPPADFTLRGICGFPLRVETVANRAKQTTFSNGTQLVTGRLVVRLTNVRTGASEVVNISGPAGSSPPPVARRP